MSAPILPAVQRRNRPGAHDGCTLRARSLVHSGSRAPLQAAPEAVGSYRFNQQHIDHHYCTQCGIAPFSEGLNPKTGEMGVAVNVRCLPAVDLAGLQVHAIDGASR
ncbi:aldehyde-activating protein [Xanthomonas euvesicatoria]|uniref:aldehyde-activating protein n=1 Tax=Xanthomonas euvesicatoria TaxID=456327 RepID=UPI0031BB22D2